MTPDGKEMKAKTADGEELKLHTPQAPLTIQVVLPDTTPDLQAMHIAGSAIQHINDQFDSGRITAAARFAALSWMAALASAEGNRKVQE